MLAHLLPAKPVFGLSICADGSGMARTRAGLSGRPACRSGRLDHALLWSSINHARQVPRFVLPSGRRPAGNAFLFWLFVFLLPRCLIGLVKGYGGGATLRGLPRFKTGMAVGHPFMGRGSRRRWGNPEGVPRSQTALRRFVLRRRSSYPRFLALQLQAIFIGKKKL